MVIYDKSGVQDLFQHNKSTPPPFFSFAAFDQMGRGFGFGL
jgi:hypothetical protein